MLAKHAQVVWFGTPEATQASLLLSAMQEEASAPTSDATLAPPEVEVEISTDPIHPTLDTVEGTEDIPSKLTSEQEQELLADEESPSDAPRPPVPDDKFLLQATSFAPSDLRQ